MPVDAVETAHERLQVTHSEVAVVTTLQSSDGALVRVPPHSPEAARSRTSRLSIPLVFSVPWRRARARPATQFRGGAPVRVPPPNGVRSKGPLSACAGPCDELACRPSRKRGGAWPPASLRRTPRL